MAELNSDNSPHKRSLEQRKQLPITVTTLEADGSKYRESDVFLTPASLKWLDRLIVWAVDNGKTVNISPQANFGGS